MVWIKCLKKLGINKEWIILAGVSSCSRAWLAVINHNLLLRHSNQNFRISIKDYILSYTVGKLCWHNCALCDFFGDFLHTSTWPKISIFWTTYQPCLLSWSYNAFELILGLYIFIHSTAHIRRVLYCKAIVTTDC